jgi:hypothetical protein
MTSASEITRRTPAAVVQSSPQSPALSVISPATASALEAAATQAVTGFTAASSGSILAQLEVAANIEQLRTLFDDPQIKARIIALQDAPIGFRTDKDPKIKNFRTAQYNTPYPYEIVKDIVIEASLRGLQLVGNQFNIIAGRFYCTKEGFEGLIRKLDFVTDFCPSIGVPMAKSGGVVIECSAAWKQNGSKRNIQASIPIKENSTGTADQYIGKATRKLLKRCYEMMTGNSISDGDAQDSQPMSAIAVGPAQTPVASALAPAAPVASTSSAGLNEQQINAIHVSASRQLTDIGYAALMKDMLAGYGVDQLEEIPAQDHGSIMRSISNPQNRENWNQNKNHAGEPILNEDELAELETQSAEQPAEAQPAAEQPVDEDDDTVQTELV